jgi:hypothetical protein
MSSEKSGQEAAYDRLYDRREADPGRPDRRSPTFRYLGRAGLLEDRSSLLDIGSGIGKDVRLAVVAHGFKRAMGVDTSGSVISDAKEITAERVKGPLRRRISFVEGDIRDKSVRMPSGGYDLVTATSVIHLMQPGEAEILLRAAAQLANPRGGLLAVAAKTLRSGDIRPVEEGGKSAGLLEKGEGYELHQSDDGLQRYYYDPAAVGAMVEQAGVFEEVNTAVMATPYGSVEDCEFAIATAVKL